MLKDKLDPRQYARKKHSTTGALLYTLQAISTRQWILARPVHVYSLLTSLESYKFILYLRTVLEPFLHVV